MSTTNKTSRPPSAVAPSASIDADLDAQEALLAAREGTLTRQDLALAIFNRLEGVSRREAKRIIDTVIDELVTTLTNGEPLKLHDFGSFVVRAKHERSGRNPRTGAPVPVAQKTIPFFKTGKQLRDRLNGKESDGAESDDT